MVIFDNNSILSLEKVFHEHSDMLGLLDGVEMQLPPKVLSCMVLKSAVGRKLLTRYCICTPYKVFVQARDISIPRTASTPTKSSSIPSGMMSLSAPCTAARCCRLAFRSPVTSSTRCLRLTSSSFNRRRKHCRRWQSTDAAATNPKISGIVDQISQLTLLETADLVASLKVRDSRPPNFLPQAFSSLSLPPHSKHT